MQTRAELLKAVAWILGITAGILIAIYLAASLMIGLGINRTSRSAMAQFDGDRIEALIALLDCENCQLKDRNH